MNRILKPELINYKLNKQLKVIVYREFKKSSELSSINAKENIIDKDYNDSINNQPKIKSITNINPKYNLKLLIPNLKFKEDDKLHEEISNYNLIFESNLRSFLYSLINLNLEDDAFKTLEYYNNKKSSLTNLGPTISLKLINIIVKKYALNNNLNGIENCLNLINQINFKPDLVFYSYYLYALSKRNHLTEIDNIINNLQRRQLNLNNLFENSYLNNEQRNLVVDALIKCGYNFNFKITKNLEYNTKLLDNYQRTKRASFSPLKDIEFNEELLNEQLNNEKSIYVKLESAYKTEKNQHNEQLINELSLEWTKKLRKTFENNLKLMKIQNESDYRINIYPFLRSLDLDKLSKFLVTFLIELTKSKYPSNHNYLINQIGYLLENQYLSSIKLKNFKRLKKIYKNYYEYISDETKFSQSNSRQFFNKIFNDLDLYNREYNEMIWSSKLRKDIGNYVLQICIETLRFNQNLLKPKYKIKLMPALFKTTQFENGIRNDVIASNTLLNKISTTLTNYALFSAKDIPMLVPPFPWTSAEGFPFLISKLFLVIEPNVIYERKIAEKLINYNINGVLDSLNYTSLTAWKINNDILQILNKIFQSGGDYKLDLPHHYSKMPELPKKEPDEDLKAFKKRTFELKKQNKEMYSLWCEMNYKLSIANYLKDKLFWFPNFIDFRGRVYPTSIYLSQVSNDIGRSLLLFGKGKKLGNKGFDWLKIHLINLTGTKKSATNQERLEYANKILDNIIDSAENPLNGRGWWKENDDPWQTLACCIEINKVLKSNKPPEEFISNFPVHQDGSCNGLQHYAALGRDLDGARSVNLLPQNRPADVYSEVASIVERKRKKDAENGDESAICLDGYINRKLVKATVMTNVYGVTNYGAKLQFKKVLQDIDRFPKDKLSISTVYLARTVFSTIEDLFTCSKEIQDWLIAISIAISKRLNLPVEWVTPLGLPVVQYYYKEKFKEVKVDSNRQKNGCPPNFIHSLDATHMMLTSLYCEKEGINFASVHDSFWTHPQDLDKMGYILREQFVNLYSDDLLNNLSNCFLDVYKPHLINNSLSVDKIDLQILNLIKNVPNRGIFDINQVKESKYFFS